MRGEAFLDLRTAETEHLQRQRGVKGRSHRAQPVVQRVFRPTDGTLGTIGQPAGYLDGFRVELGIFDRERDEPDAFGLLAQHLVAQQQVVFRLGEPAEQRPDDRGMVPGGDPEPGMPVDNAAILACDRHVRQEAADEPGADRNPAHRADHRLTAVDHVVDDVARLLPLPSARFEIIDILPDDRKIAARREYSSGAGDDRGIDACVAVDIAPDLGELAMQCLVGRVHATVLHRDAENLRMRAVEFEPRIAGVWISHRKVSSAIRCSPTGMLGGWRLVSGYEGEAYSHAELPRRRLKCEPVALPQEINPACLFTRP